MTIGRLHRALVAPCTTTIRGLPSEVRLEPGTDPVPLPSVANLDTERMGEVCAALVVATGCGQVPQKVW